MLFNYLSILGYTGVINGFLLFGGRGLRYGQDCKPIADMDYKNLQAVSNSSEYNSIFKDVPIVTLSADEWTPGMENIYAQSLLADSRRCRIIEGLECDLVKNENTAEVNFHHHHPSHKQGGNESQTTEDPIHFLESRRADVIIEENLLEFDEITELDPEWRCVCNPASSVHHSARVRNPAIPYPIFNDTCLIKVGFPCQYKIPEDTFFSSILGHSVTFKEKYPCIPEAICVDISASGNATTSDSGKNSTSTSPEDMQVQIENIVGYRMNLGAFRPAFQNYILRHMTHICACPAGSGPNGDGLCVKGGGLEGRAGETNVAVALPINSYNLILVFAILFLNNLYLI